MNATRGDLDIFVCSGERHFGSLRRLLPLLRRHGTVHVGSSFLRPDQMGDIKDRCDFIHEPRLHPDPYRNFLLFFIREVTFLARAPRILKVDTDIELAPDWYDYVEEALARHPEAVLLGTHAGTNPIDYDISGPLVRRRLGADVRVRDGLKVNGSFLLADTHFLRKHHHTMQVLHDLIYAFEDGRRVQPCHLEDFDPDEEERLGADLVRMRGVCARRQGRASYDNLLSLTAHVVGAGERLFVEDPGDRIGLPDKRVPPSPFKRVLKWLRGRAGIPWRPGKRPVV